MKTTIDRAGRVVIPKELRERAGLNPGSAIDIQCHDGRIEISAPRPKGKLVRKGSLLVWQPARGTPKFTVEDVNRAIEEIRDEREQQILKGAGD